MAVLRRRLDFRRISIIEILDERHSRVLVTLGLALLGLNAPALVFGCVVGMAIAVLSRLVFAPVPLPGGAEGGPRPAPLRRAGGAATLAWAGFRNGDYAVIGATLGAAQAGIYWRAYQLAVEYQRKVAVAMTQMAFPVLARTAGNGGDARPAPAHGAAADRRPLPAAGAALPARAGRRALALRPGLGAARWCRPRSSSSAAPRPW